MDGIVPTIILVSLIALVVLWLMNEGKFKKITSLESTVSELYNERNNLVNKNIEANSYIAKSKEREEALNRLIVEKNKQFPWLATAHADYLGLLGKMDEALLRKKKRPAPVAADKVREVTKRAIVAEKNFRLLKYRIDFFEKYFPWITDVTGDTLEEILNAQEISSFADQDEDQGDPVLKMLSKQEYAAMTSAERNQLALERWQKNKKSNWEIGRMYERFIGFNYEKQGCRVEYFGAISGFDDLGRDLIVEKDGKIKIVQCKYWAKNKIIHEKHIFQLFGTVIEYIARNKIVKENQSIFVTFKELSAIKPVFVTSAGLSERAREFASLLEVEVNENVPLGDYPLIKCNVSRRRGERVYHLPFDQQYDRTVIEPERGEFYAWTAGEAEGKKFRRAYRWHPEKGD